MADIMNFGILSRSDRDNFLLRETETKRFLILICIMVCFIAAPTTLAVVGGFIELIQERVHWSDRHTKALVTIVNINLSTWFILLFLDGVGPSNFRITNQILYGICHCYFHDPLCQQTNSEKKT